ncbi:sulfotransferase family protein [Mycobacterium sp. MS1601]|uniref:sulfotransferase family protein n=1 Tax=Mycobacterium sp. MS1601 TaxID=1936029 RepID=UPI0009795F02|nr:sulfotransferase [Mycobacterium sp. MS1601]AQA05199.1 sulfotransferase family protein [Mycobacterium sp. MS1601]
MDRGQPCAQSGTGTRPVVLFVVGFGRSGTSALTRVLSLCGADLPPGLLGATTSNPRGYWEPRAVIHLNEAILRRYGGSGYDLSLCRDQGQRDAARDSTSIADIRGFLSTLPAAPLMVIKEPKMTAVCDLWFEAARNAGFDVASVIAVRHPGECVGSVEKRSRRQLYVGSSPELVSAWWLKYSLLAERHTRGVPRVFVGYSNLMEDWRREVKRIGSTLDIDLDRQDVEAVDRFLKPDLRHHRLSGPVQEPFGTDWMGVTYEAMSAAARDERWEESVLDRVYDAYRASECGFRTAIADARRYRNLNKVLHPTVVKVALGVLAAANRHKGTWA